MFQKVRTPIIALSARCFSGTACNNRVHALIFAYITWKQVFMPTIEWFDQRACNASRAAAGNRRIHICWYYRSSDLTFSSINLLNELWRSKCDGNNCFSFNSMDCLCLNKVWWFESKLYVFSKRLLFSYRICSSGLIMHSCCLWIEKGLSLSKI